MYMNVFRALGALRHLVCGVQIYNAFSFTNKLFEGFFLVIFLGAGNEGFNGAVV